jgi:hypothetical protein
MGDNLGVEVFAGPDRKPIAAHRRVLNSMQHQFPQVRRFSTTVYYEMQRTLEEEPPGRSLATLMRATPPWLTRLSRMTLKIQGAIHLLSRTMASDKLQGV